MDTDDLSSEAYKAIIIEAENFNHDLTLQFGLLASSCKNENEYLSKAKKLIAEIKSMNANDLDFIFFGFIPNKKKLSVVLDKILTNIAEVEKILENERYYDF